MEDKKQLVVFNLDRELFGVAISQVREIIKMVKPCKIPNMPDYVSGVANLRGKITIIYDLSKRLGMQEKAFSEEAKIIVTNENNTGFMVDQVKK